MKSDISDRSWRKFSLKPVNKKAKKIEKASLRHARKFVVGRWSNLRSIRRHVVAWLFLVGLLCGLTVVQILFNYTATTTPSPQQGGVYAEGSVDSFRTLNPLFATAHIERSAIELIFSGLLRHDEKGIVQPDIAKTWIVEDRGKKYTIKLRDDLKWHDGKRLTARDVEYTIKTIQDPKVGAVQQRSWRGIKIDVPDDQTVIFTLPNAYAPFASLLTTAILPRHILENEKTDTLQESAFGRAPIGSGPFVYNSLTTVDLTSGKTVLQLNANDNYWQGRPYVNRFSLTAYGSEAELIRALKSHEINAANDLSDRVIRQVKDVHGVSILSPSINNGVYAFFNNDSIFLKDAKVRQALVQATDTEKVRATMGGSTLKGPIISTQLSSAEKISQYEYDTKRSHQLFSEAGFTQAAKERTTPEGKPVTLRVVSINNSEYRTIVENLKKQWKKVGVSVQERFIDPEQIQQSVLQPRDYDVLIHELEVGGDPDVYAYWHSSQASIMGANFSNYRSDLADDALVAARLRTPWDVRDARYASFAEQWVKDAPAIALYKPQLHYATYGQVNSIQSTDVFPSYSDRFSRITEWSIQQDRSYKTP